MAEPYKWVHIIVPAPATARCSFCKAPITGTDDYHWRPTMSDTELAFCHPKCLQEADAPDRREMLIRELALLMLPAGLPIDAEEFLQHREFGLALHALADEVMKEVPGRM